MTKYSFVLLSGKSDEFLKNLQEVGLVDITRSRKPVDKESAAMLEKAEEYRKAAERLTAMDFESDPGLEKLKAASESIEFDDPLKAFKEAYSDLEELRKSLDEATREVENRRAWGNYDAKALRSLDDLGLRVRFYKTPKKAYSQDWALKYPLQEIADDGKNVWFVTVSDDKEYSFPIEDLPFPEGDLEDAENKVLEIKARMNASKGVLYSLKRYIPLLKDECSSANSQLQIYLANEGSGKAVQDYITTFEGFAPEENDEELCKAFDSMDVLYIKEKASVEDNPPIKFKNNRFTSMFEVLTDMYGRPAYNGFDPTPFIAVFFMLFFAFCMGDCGYGLILIAFGFGMKKALGEISPLVVTLGIATTVIGFLFHTFFSMDISQWGWIKATGLDKIMLPAKIAGYDGTMVLALIIGVIHLCLAMVVKTYNATKQKGFLNSLGTWGWTLLIVGGVTVGAFALTGVIDKRVTKVTVIVLGCVSAAGIFLLNDLHRNPLLNIGSGLWETYNTVTGLLGDVLSYLRLYALGLAGSMLGKAFNDIGMMILGDGTSIPMWFFFILIVVIGHALNIAMCVLGAFVHPLRLNFLEFFKNSGYEAAGRSWDPLRKQ